MLWSHTRVSFFLQVKDVDIFDEDALAEELRGKDGLVSCIGAPGSLLDSQEVTLYIESVKLFANALRKSGVSRLVVMSAWYSEGMLFFKCFTRMFVLSP